MRIKGKLIIALCVIFFTALCMMTVILLGIQWIQKRAIEKTYNIEKLDSSMLTNSVWILDQMTSNEFEKLKMAAHLYPYRYSNQDFLEEINSSLTERNSYLVVRKGNGVFYVGGDISAKELPKLPNYGETDKVARSGIHLDSSQNMLFKQVDFWFEDGEEGSAFIITSARNTVPEIRRLIVELVFSVIVVMAITGFLLFGWVYQSMITPIQRLRTAAENIRKGNLEFEVQQGGKDEIGELCQTFEKMRVRLKENAEEKLRDEKESKDLLSNIAHDLKTPITAVKGYSEGIMDGVANTPEKIDKYIRTIYNKANEMDRLLNELTLFSKIDTNRVPYNYAKLNVKSYFGDCVEELTLDFEDKGIRLDYLNETADDIMVIADPEQLSRVINNIVGNSIKYMDKSEGIISFRVKDVGDFVQVEIEDNGCGIDQEDLPYIFDRFYRTDASRNSATGGSGIGLSIVKKIVEDHGGKIWTTSKMGEGTAMFFVIRKFF